LIWFSESATLADVNQH